MQTTLYNCPNCQKNIRNSSRFCPSCGFNVSNNLLAPTVVAPSPGQGISGDANIALIIEAIPGFFGLLGLGHVFSGRTWIGIGTMVAWFIYIIIASLITSLTLGAAGCLTIPILIVVPLVSGYIARTHVQKNNGEGHWKPVLIFGGSGCLFIVVAILTVLIALANS